MAGKQGATCLVEAMRAMSISSLSPARQALPSLPRFASSWATQPRTFATVVTAPSSKTKGPEAEAPKPVASETPDAPKPASSLWFSESTVPVTIYDFPSLEPRSVESWPAKHLHLPLRRDILHLAVTYEGDATRQGTASSKTRYDVHGSNRKMARQKGTGRARVGDKKSPLQRGGGKTFGPHPRDFSTRLNRKVYDLAWRTALSYRYSRGELFVMADALDFPLPDDFLKLAEEGRLGRELEDGFVGRAVRDILTPLGWGHDGGRSTFVTESPRVNMTTCMDVAGYEARTLEAADVDVKDLLETGRIVIERSALVRLIREHQSDLVSKIFINGSRITGPLAGQTAKLVE